MFGLFKKKVKKEEPVSAKQDNGLQGKLTEQFGLFEEDTIQLSAVTDAQGFLPLEKIQPGDEGPWLVVLGLTAWSEDDAPTQRGRTKLIATADAKLLAYLNRLAPRDSMIQVQVRKAENGEAYLMQELPSPINDPELKAILNEQVKEVSIEAEGLGTFVLDRKTGFFLGDVSWCGQDIQMSYLNTHKEAQQTGRFLLEEAESWNTKALAAAQTAWQTENPEEELPELELTSIDLEDEGVFSFWFTGEELPEPLCVQGNLKEGFLTCDEERQS